MALFGKKKNAEQTVLLLDIENGSVGAGLAHLSPTHMPRLFGETRLSLPLLATHNAGTLAQQIERATREVLEHSAVVAARLRNNKNTQNLGKVNRVAVFLNAPWGVPNLAEGKPEFAPGMREFLAGEATAFAGDVPVSYYTGADAAAYGARILLPQENILLCIVRGEIIELMLLGEGAAQGYATIPLGARSVARTLGSHGNLSEAQVRSFLSLPQLEHSAAYEPLAAAGEHFLEHFSGAAQELLTQGGANSVFVVAEEPLGNWFAKTLEGSGSVAALFPEGGVVRALKSHHIAPHVSANTSNPDMHLMLETLFADRRFL